VSHVSCCIQGEVDGLQVLLGSLHPRSMRASSSSPRRKLISFASIVSLTLTVAVYRSDPLELPTKTHPSSKSPVTDDAVRLHSKQSTCITNKPTQSDPIRHQRTLFFLIEYAINPSNSSQFHHAHITITTEEQPVLTDQRSCQCLPTNPESDLSPDITSSNEVLSRR